MTTITLEEREAIAKKYSELTGKRAVDVNKKSPERYFDKLERAGITAEELNRFFDEVVTAKPQYSNIYEDVLTLRDVKNWKEGTPKAEAPRKEAAPKEAPKEEAKEEAPKAEAKKEEAPKEEAKEAPKEAKAEAALDPAAEKMTAALAEYIAAAKRGVDAEEVERIARKVYEEAPTVTKKIEWDVQGKEYKPDGLTHERFDEVLRILSVRRFPYLYGPAGTGKSYMARQLADALGVDLYYQSQVFQPYELTGYMDANGKYQPSTFYRAFKNGGLYMLDEVDASVPEAVTPLNDALANLEYTFPNGERVKAPKNFYCIGAGNTFGTGANEEYSARSALDASTRDRFMPVHVGYDRRVEEGLTSDAALLDFVRSARTATERAGIKLTVSYRAITALSDFDAVGIAKKDAVTAALWKHLQRDDIQMIVNELPTGNEYTDATRAAYNL